MPLSPEARKYILQEYQDDSRRAAEQAIVLVLAVIGAVWALLDGSVHGAPWVAKTALLFAVLAIVISVAAKVLRSTHFAIKLDKQDSHIDYRTTYAGFLAHYGWWGTVVSAACSVVFFVLTVFS